MEGRYGPIPGSVSMITFFLSPTFMAAVAIDSDLSWERAGTSNQSTATNIYASKAVLFEAKTLGGPSSLIGLVLVYFVLPSPN